MLKEKLKFNDGNPTQFSTPCQTDQSSKDIVNLHSLILHSAPNGFLAGVGEAIMEAISKARKHLLKVKFS
ncbi:hypothetical protein [Pseudomonas putida]|uniref:hypothetical protein n=1 Tax=Pseudomonas putida TaxID=303 RepID=UPI000D3D34B4|nr:hypothetical protein [Pseudomonas putida]PTV64418.1 hypothetical protein DBL03_05565 [Pseudomonas putida]